MSEAIKGRYYRHKKGGLYQVLDLAKHSETQEEMVVYWSITYSSLWVRPRDLFEDEGRFELLDAPPLEEGHDSSGREWTAERCKSLKCQGARITVGFDVSDDDWKAVTDGAQCCLCLRCFDEAAQDRGVKYKLLDLYPVLWSSRDAS